MGNLIKQVSEEDKPMSTPFIMLVDDEVQFVETTAKRLTARNMNVISAFNAEECLEKIKARPEDIDVVILDIKMPGMNGIAALKEIKKRSPLMEVIMLTGHGTIDSAIASMKLGAWDFLMKPFDIEELFSKIEKAVQHKREREKKIEEAQKQETLSRYGPFYYT